MSKVMFLYLNTKNVVCNYSFKFFKIIKTVSSNYGFKLKVKTVINDYGFNFFK